jgi:hypothetical protein
VSPVPIALTAPSASETAELLPLFANARYRAKRSKEDSRGDQGSSFNSDSRAQEEAEYERDIKGFEAYKAVTQTGALELANDINKKSLVKDLNSLILWVDEVAAIRPREDRSAGYVRG